MKILFIFPNVDQGGYKPVGLSAIMSNCRAKGHEIRLFDTSYMDTSEFTTYTGFSSKGMTDSGSQILNLKVCDLSSYDLEQEEVDIAAELRHVLNEFQPDVVAISVLSIEWSLSVHLLRTVKKFDESIFTVLGGIHAYADADGSIKENSIDAVCVGEGEEALIELLKRVEAGKDYENTPGFLVKRNGSTFRNKVGQVVEDLNTLPYLDYGIYSDKLNIKQFDGKVYRGGDHVITRGCPAKCSYCLFDTMNALNDGDANLRRYEIDRIIAELKMLKENFNLNFYRFQDSTFLSIPNHYLNEFADRYSKEIALPFVIDVMPQSVTKEKVLALAKMGCASAGVGTETGNEQFRSQIGKPVKDKTIRRAFNLIEKYGNGMYSGAFLLMGFPMETRDYYWDSVNFVKDARVNGPTIGFVYPFKGTTVRDDAIRMGLFDPEAEERGEIGYHRLHPVIKNPHISPEEYRGMMRAFILYVKFPKRFWSEIKEAEKSTDKGENVYKKFAEAYVEHDLFRKFLPENKPVFNEQKVTPEPSKASANKTYQPEKTRALAGDLMVT